MNTNTTPPGGYVAILADPPWSPSQTGALGAERHYSLMTNDKILAMGEAVQALAAENSFCFLWVTTATVPLGIEVLEAWGYRYTSYYFWAKPRFTLGNTFRNAGELLLLGVRGKGTKASPSPRPTPSWSSCCTPPASRTTPLLMRVRSAGARDESRILNRPIAQTPP